MSRTCGAADDQRGGWGRIVNVTTSLDTMQRVAEFALWGEQDGDRGRRR